MANIKCKVCGTEFPAIRERHYISGDLTKTGLAVSFGSTSEPALWDSYDCPNCGCQVHVPGRNRRYTNPPIEDQGCPCRRECCMDEDDEDEEDDE